MAIEFKEVDLSSKFLMDALSKNKANDIVLITSDNKCLVITGSAKVFPSITAAQAKKLIK